MYVCVCVCVCMYVQENVCLLKSLVNVLVLCCLVNKVFIDK